MKKNILLLLVTDIAFLSMNAQAIKLGVDGGISIPELKSSGTNEISQGYTSRLAAVFGAFADFGINKKFSIKTFVNYAGQGGKRNGMQPVTDIPPAFAQMLPPGTTLYADFNNEAILNYLEIPVMAKWQWGKIWKYYVNAGPYIGFLLSAKQKTSGSSQFYFDKAKTQPLTIQGQPVPAQSFDATTDVKKDIRSANFGITGGGGLVKSINKVSDIIFDLRLAYGLTVIQKDTQANGKSRTGGIFITIGYTYSIY